MIRRPEAHLRIHDDQELPRSVELHLSHGPDKGYIVSGAILQQVVDQLNELYRWRWSSPS